MAIKKTQRKLDIEEQKLPTHLGDSMTPPNLFEEHAGHFWGILATQDYMRARFVVANALLEVRTYAAVQAAHDHIMGMVQLSRNDEMGLRHLVPALKLRLGRDQECYDFCMWYATTGHTSSEYDWEDTSLPFLDVESADVFEPVHEDLSNDYTLSHTVGMALLKIKVFLTMKALRNASILGGKEGLLPEILDAIRSQLVGGTLITDRVIIEDYGKQTELIHRLQAQIKMLYRATTYANKHFWRTLLNPGEHLIARQVRQDDHSPGSIGQMRYILIYCYDAWVETPGAIDVIRQLMEKKT